MLTYQRGMLREGCFGWPGRSGMMLSDGYFWARRAGGYNFYLGLTGTSGIDFANPIAACGSDRSDLTVGGVFQSDRDHWLGIKAVSGFGRESEGYSWIRLRTDSQLDGKAVPAPVENLRAKLGGAGRIALTWEYRMRPGWPVPSTFKIYGKTGAWPIDFSQPLQDAGGDVQVPYRPSQWQYYWDNRTDTLGPGPWRLVVRAETADGTDDGSQRYIIAMTDYSLPGRIDGYKLEQLDN